MRDHIEISVDFTSGGSAAQTATFTLTSPVSRHVTVGPAANPLVALFSARTSE